MFATDEIASPVQSYMGTGEGSDRERETLVPVRQPRIVVVQGKAAGQHRTRTETCNWQNPIRGNTNISPPFIMLRSRTNVWC